MAELKGQTVSFRHAIILAFSLWNKIATTTE